MQSVCVTKTGGFVDATNVARPSCQRLVVFHRSYRFDFHWALKPLGAHTTIAQTLLMPDFHTGWCGGSLPNGYFLSHSSLNQNLSVAYMLLSQLLFTLLWVVSIYSILVNARERKFRHGALQLFQQPILTHLLTHCTKSSCLMKYLFPEAKVWRSKKQN